MKWRKLRRWQIGILVVLTGLALRLFWPKPPSFFVSPETTRLVEPLDAEGYLDYPRVVNQYLSQGITPEQNANVLLWKALGPHPEGTTMPAVYFEWLGIPSPPEGEGYFLGWVKFLEIEKKGEERREEAYERLNAASKNPWKSTEEPLMAKWLTHNEKPLKWVMEASLKPRYFHPLVSRFEDPRTPRMLNCLLPSTQECRGLAQALMCRAMQSIGEGRYDAAWQDLMICRRLGALLTQGGTLVEQLVGFSIADIAMNGQANLLAHYSPPAPQVKSWLTELQKIPANQPVASKVDAVERYVMLDSLQSVALGGELDQEPGRPVKKRAIWDNAFRRHINYNSAFQNLHAQYDRIAAATALEDRFERRKHLNELKEARVQPLGPLDKYFLSSEELGLRISDTLVGMIFPAVEKITNSADRAEQTRRNLHIAFALAAYRADQGKYPARLDDLAPQYLAKIPIDLFSGKSLIYKPTKEGYLLYSVGINEKDDEGQGYQDEPRGDDLRIRMK